MLTVYFADDDILIINELKSIINWEENYFKIVGYNTDPEIAKLEIIEKNPTLVICDVQMDGLNGLKLAELIKKTNPNIDFVYLSAYDKFDYAVEAIRLGAIRYIKKPLKKDDLINLLLEIKKKNQNDLSEQIYNALVNHNDNLIDLFKNNPFLPHNKPYNVISLNGKNHQMLIEEIQKNSSLTYLIYSDENFATIIAFNLKNYDELIKKYNDLSIVISPILENYNEIDKYLRLTRIATKQKFLTNKNEHLVVDDNKSYLDIYNKFKDCEHVFELQQYIKDLKLDLINKHVIVYNLQYIYRSIVYALIRFNLVDYDILDISILDEYENIDDLISDLLNYFANNENNDFSELIISEVKNKLKNNIKNKIPLSYFAESYGYNISYFSQLFKKVVGTSYAEYFILLKMDQAKLLITNTSMSLQNIASEVGYDDYYHFSKMFKKYTKYSPTEFRNLYHKK